MIFEKLIKIQQELNAPKDLHNDFGNYYYKAMKWDICKSDYLLLFQFDDLVQYYFLTPNCSKKLKA